MKLITFLTLFLGLGCQLFAQEFSLFYNSDDFQLSQKQKDELQGFIKELPHRPFAYQVKIDGFCDASGSVAQNRVLSTKRAETIKQHLLAAEFRSNNITAAGKGSIPIALEKDLENQKSEARRVDIAFSPIQMSVPDVLGVKPPGEDFEIDATTGTTVEYNGNVISIPPNAFVDSEGNPIKGKVKLKYREFRTVTDFILSDVTMTLLQQKEAYHFHSAGMFSLEAFQKNEKLELADGASANVLFRLEENTPGINFYRYDSETRTWGTIAQVTSKFSSINDRDWMCGTAQLRNGPLGDTIYHYPCAMPECQQDVYAVNTVTKMAIGKTGMTPHMLLLDSSIKTLETLPKKRRQNQHRGEKRSQKLKDRKELILKSTPVFYLFDTKLRGKNYVSIRMKSKYSMGTLSHKDNPCKDFAVKPTYAGRAIRRRIGGKGFDRVEMVEQDERIVLRLMGSDTVDIPIKSAVQRSNSKRKMTKQQQRELIWNVDDLLEEQQKVIADLEKEMQKDSLAIDSMWSLGFVYRTRIDTAIARRSRLDSLLCLHQYDMLLDSSASTDRITWANNFDKNKEAYKARYGALKKGDRFKACEEAEKKRKALIRELEEKRRKAAEEARKKWEEENKELAARQKATNQAFKELKIDRLGMYNCDQIRRMANAREIRPTFTDADGKELDIFLAFVTDRSMNGIVRYDGYGGMSPYKMSIGKFSTKLIAVSEFGSTWVYDLKENRNALKGKKPVIVLKNQIVKGNLESLDKAVSEKES